MGTLTSWNFSSNTEERADVVARVLAALGLSFVVKRCLLRKDMKRHCLQTRGLVCSTSRVYQQFTQSKRIHYRSVPPY